MFMDRYHGNVPLIRHPSSFFLRRHERSGGVGARAVFAMSVISVLPPSGGLSLEAIELSLIRSKCCLTCLFSLLPAHHTVPPTRQVRHVGRAVICSYPKNVITSYGKWDDVCLFDGFTSALLSGSPLSLTVSVHS